MKLVTLFSILLTSLSSLAISEAEYIYGGNAERALEACLSTIEERIATYIRDNSDMPVIDVGQLREDYENDCQAMAEREVAESDTENIYESKIQENLENDSVSFMELFANYSLTPNDLFNFYVQDKTSFVVIGGVGLVATLSLIKNWDRLTMGGGKGKVLRTILLSALGLSVASGATAHEIHEVDFDFNILRARLVKISNLTNKPNQREQFVLEQFSLEELEFLLKAQSEIIEQQNQLYLNQCAATPGCQAL